MFAIKRCEVEASSLVAIALPLHHVVLGVSEGAVLRAEHPCNPKIATNMSGQRQIYDVLKGSIDGCLIADDGNGFPLQLGETLRRKPVQTDDGAHLGARLPRPQRGIRRG